MAKGFRLSAVALFSVFLLPAGHAQDIKQNEQPDFFNNDQPKGVAEELAKRKWNNSPPVKSFC